MTSASTEHTKKRGLSSATSESISGNSAIYFSQKKPSVSPDDLPFNTEEGKRQRRFDSLSRVLSLHSKNSACAAVTILNSELIIAANCTDGKEPAAIAQLLQQRLSVLREALRKNYSDILLLESPAQAETFFKEDLDKLQLYGDFYQPRSVLAQALYKLNKSISGQNDPSTQDEAFSAEEIAVILNSDNFTVLVAGEEQRTDESGLQQDWDLSDMTTTALSPSYTNSSFTTRSTLMSASDHSSSTTSMLSPTVSALSDLSSPVRHTPGSSATTSMPPPTVGTLSDLSSPVRHTPGSSAMTSMLSPTVGTLSDLSSPASHMPGSSATTSMPPPTVGTLSDLSSPAHHTPGSSSMDGVGKSSRVASGFTGLWKKADKPCSNSKPKSKFFGTSESDSDSDSDSDCSSNTDTTDVATKANAQHQEDNEEDFFLSSLNESFASKLETSSSSFSMSMFAIRYGMNIYQNGSTTQIAFPESIYHTANKPRDVSAFHAEQLIAFYLRDVKGINLHDITAPPIPFGISKLCCAACTILYQFERIKIRGTSFNNILGVPRIITVADTSSASATGSVGSVATESIFSSPQKKSATLPIPQQSFNSPAPSTRVAKGSPWS